MKITLYTVTECQFSKQEKEYFSSHNLPFEEKNLETNRDFLTEMLTLSNNFAGTPVTKIEKDDGQIVVLKGFTLEEFDKTLGFAAQPVTQPPVSEPTPPPVQNQVQEPVEEDMPAPVPPPVIPVTQPPMAPPQQPQPPQAPQQPETPNPMNAVLNNLQDQASAPPPLPNIPDPKL